jgi:hypothetical protein
MKRSKLALRSIIAAVFAVAMIAPAQGAETSTLVTLTAPTDLAGVPALPFTTVKSAAFTIPETGLTLDVTPQQGHLGEPFTVTGKGLPANKTLALTWSTGDGTWVTDILPNSVNYMGVKYTKYNVDMASVTTDATGGFTFKTTVPSDFGGVHDIYAVDNGVALAHGGYQMLRTVSITPKSGPVGTPITVTYTGLGASLYTAGGSILWDNKYAGEAQALWTRGTAKFVVRAAGDLGKHVLQVQDGIGITYLNINQSPVPFANGGSAEFTVTKGNGKIPAPYLVYPKKVTPTVALRTTLSSINLDPATRAVATLSKEEGPVGTKTTINVTGMSTTGAHQITWATVVGNRVNCVGTCWVYNGVSMGSVDVTGADFSKEVEIPDHLGGWHVIQIKKGDVIEAQVPFYVQESIFAYKDKSGKVLSMGIAKADPSPLPESRNGSGVPTNTFKAGDEFTIAIKGVGWTQLDNTLAVTYDNSYIGYGCGFNSNGYMVVHLKATGAPGIHIIDLHPLMYTNQPSFANTPYGMLPILTADRDFPGLALGYQLPSIHFAINIVK